MRAVLARLLAATLILGGCAACQPGRPPVPVPPPAPPTTLEPGPAGDTYSTWLNEDGSLTCPLDHHQEGGTCVPD